MLTAKIVQEQLVLSFEELHMPIQCSAYLR